jgi:hypothetical protein
MSKRVLRSVLIGGVVAGAIWAADDPFVGEWKLDPAKSKLTDEMKVESAGGNKYAFDFGGGTAETIVTDGTDQPGLAGTTLAVTVEGPDSWKVVRKKDGRMLLTANWKLSEDGNTLSDDYTEIGPNGSNSNVKYVYQRTAGTSGFAGTWESTSEQVNFVLMIQVRPYEGDGLSIVNRSEEVIRSLKFDGKDYPIQGANVPKGLVSSGRRVSDRNLQIADKINGKTVATEQIELSPDHKTLTMTKQAATRSKPNIFVFERQ